MSVVYGLLKGRSVSLITEDLLLNIEEYALNRWKVAIEHGKALLNISTTVLTPLKLLLNIGMRGMHQQTIPKHGQVPAMLLSAKAM